MGIQLSDVVVNGKTIELNEQFLKALSAIEKGRHVFVTGRAGTGKSTLLQLFRERAAGMENRQRIGRGRNVAVLAPTGVAALNVDGQTIHSFFGFRPDVTLERVGRAQQTDVYRTVDTMVVDEVSMVRADLLDCMDKFLRLNRKDNRPFGGVQMVFIGDLYQLPPVLGKEAAGFRAAYKSPYFFDAKVYQELGLEMVELETVYRQTDGRFIGLLNAIRNNSVSEGQLRELNSRVEPGFEAPAGYIRLTTTNQLAEEHNKKELGRLDGAATRLVGKLDGRFDGGRLPTEQELEVKEGAQVMMVNNDSLGRWVNGSVGQVDWIGRREGKTVVDITIDGETEEVRPHTWKMFRYVHTNGMLGTETTGSFTQYPFRLAWAVTIHKGQGKTFDRVVVDLGKGAFSPGQVYVALSRCTSMEGLVLEKPLEKKHVFVDWRVVNYLTGFQYQQAEKRLGVGEKRRMVEEAIRTGGRLKITYLKASDVKSVRVIEPRRLGQMEYLGKEFEGVEAYCCTQKGDRIFRLDRMLEVEEE